MEQAWIVEAVTVIQMAGDESCMRGVATPGSCECSQMTPNGLANYHQ